MKRISGRARLLRMAEFVRQKKACTWTDLEMQFGIARGTMYNYAGQLNSPTFMDIRVDYANKLVYSDQLVADDKQKVLH